MKTAVELLESEMQILFYIAKSNKIKFAELIEQAKEIEENVATEYAEFCIRCDRAGLKQVKFEDWKKSWEETFKSE